MPLINYHSVLTLKSMLSSELLSFGFSLKETITRPYDTKLKVRGLKFKRASVSDLKTELGVWGAHGKFSVEKASRLA